MTADHEVPPFGEVEPGSIVLFLDVDGVLNQCGSFQDVVTAKAMILRKIVIACGCSVVVSSTWRRTAGTRELLGRLLRECDVSIAGWTPCLDKVSERGLYYVPERGHEIQAWLDGNPHVSRFVILDDASDMAHLAEHLVQTDTFVGLTEAIAEEVIRRFS